jgi:hypothetical protein
MTQPHINSRPFDTHTYQIPLDLPLTACAFRVDVFLLNVGSDGRSCNTSAIVLYVLYIIIEPISLPTKHITASIHAYVTQFRDLIHLGLRTRHTI